MFPLAVIGGAIGAVFSIAKGASWLSDQLDSTKASAAAGSKAQVRSESDAKAVASFQAALAAQSAGQSLPTPPAAAPAPVPAALPLQQHGPDYDALARMKAGIFAYSHVGEHRDRQPPPDGGGIRLAAGRAP